MDVAPEGSFASAGRAFVAAAPSAVVERWPQVPRQEQFRSPHHVGKEQQSRLHCEQETRDSQQNCLQPQ